MFNFRLAQYNDLSATKDDKNLIKSKLIVKTNDSESVKKAKTELISLLMLFRHYKNSIPPNEKHLENCLVEMDKFCKKDTQLGITLNDCMLFAKNRYSITAKIPASLVEVFKSIPDENMKDFADFAKKQQTSIAPDLAKESSSFFERFYKFLTQYTKKIIDYDLFKIPTRGVKWIQHRDKFWSVKEGGDRDTNLGFNAFARSCGLTYQGESGVGYSKDIPEEWANWIAGVSVKENAIFSYCSEMPEKQNNQFTIHDHENRYKVTPYQATRALMQMDFNKYITVDENGQYIPLTESQRELLLTDFKKLVENIPSREPKEVKKDNTSSYKENLSKIRQEGKPQDEPKHADSLERSPFIPK